MPPTSGDKKSGFEKKFVPADSPEEKNLIIVRNGERHGVRRPGGELD